jgi:hypothetical protein
MQASPEVELVSGVGDFVLFVQVPQVAGAAKHERHASAAAKRCADQVKEYRPVSDEPIQPFGGCQIWRRLGVSGQAY